MAKLAFKVASTSRLVRLFIQDSSQTDGRGLTGLAFGTSGLVTYYIKDGQASATQITLVTATVGTWTSSGFIQIDSTNLPGVYELGLPDAALSTGKNVIVMLKGAANMVVTILEIELEAVDNQAVAGYGLTNLDATVSSRASSSALATVQADTDDIQTRLPAALVSGRIVALSQAIATDAIDAASLKTDAVTEIQTAVAAGSVASVVGAVGSVTGNVGGNVTGSVGSVVGAVGSVTGAVGSVTGNVGGNVTGSVGSVIAAVTIAAASITAIWDKATSALTTIGSIGKLLVDNIDATISSRLASASYTAPPSAATIAAAVWDRLTSALTTVGSIGKLLVDSVDTAISTRATASALTTAQADLDDIQTRLPAALDGGRMNSIVNAMAADVITASALSAGAVDEILDDTIGDSTITVRQALRVLIAGMAGKLSGAATATVTIRNVADSANVIVASVDADGNRSAVTVTP